MAHFLDLNQLLCAQTVCFARYFAQLHLLFGRRDFMQVSRRNMNGLRWLTLQRKTADIRQLPEPYLQKALHRKKTLHSINSSCSRPNDSSRYGEGKKQALLWRYIRQARAGYFLWIGIWADTDQLPCRPGDSERGLWFLKKTRLIRAPKRCLAGRQMESRRPPYAIPPAAICNPVGRHMEFRRPPSASRHE